jgi:nucleoside-diphosphate-sugar epimerase
VLRFALFYGAGDAFTRDVFRHVARGWLPMLGRPTGYVSMVSHDDAASAVVAAIRVPAGAYNVVDDEPLTRRALGDALAAIVGAPPPRLPPPWVAALGGSLGETIARSLRLSNRKLRTASGWAPRHPSAREGWRAAYEAMASATSGLSGTGVVGAETSYPRDTRR